MKPYQIFTTAVALLAAVQTTVASAAQPGAPVTLTLQRMGTSSFASAASGTNYTTQVDEVDISTLGDADSGTVGDHFAGINREVPGTVAGNGNPVKSNAKSNPQLGVHFEGLTK